MYIQLNTVHNLEQHNCIYIVIIPAVNDDTSYCYDSTAEGGGEEEEKLP